LAAPRGRAGAAPFAATAEGEWAPGREGKEAVFKVGFVFIMTIMAFVIYNDISKIFPAR